MKGSYMKFLENIVTRRFKSILTSIIRHAIKCQTIPFSFLRASLIGERSVETPK